MIRNCTLYIILILFAGVAEGQLITNVLEMQQATLESRTLRVFNDNLYFVSKGDPDFTNLATSYPDSMRSVLIGIDVPENIIFELVTSGQETGYIEDFWFDENGDYYIIGSIPGFNSGVPFYVGAHEMEFSSFLLKMNLQGDLIWSVDISNVRPKRIWIHEESIFVAGDLRYSLVFGSDTLTSAALDMDFPFNPCLLKCTSEGEPTWGRVIEGNISGFVHDMAVLSDGAVALCGTSQSNQVEFNGEQYNKGGYVCAYTASGDESWMKVGLYEDELYLATTSFSSLAINGQDEIAVAIMSSTDVFPNEIGDLTYNCTSGDVYKEAIYRWSSEGILLDALNIGCRDSFDNDAYLKSSNGYYYYASRINESTHLEDLGIPPVSGSETLLVVFDENLDYSWHLISETPDVTNHGYMLLIPGANKIFFGSTFASEVHYGDISIIAENEPESYILEIQDPNSIVESTYSSGLFSLYPNPISEGDILEIDHPRSFTATEFQVLDISGRVIAAMKVSPSMHSHFLAIEHLKAGVYLVAASTHGEVIAVKRLIVN